MNWEFYLKSEKQRTNFPLIVQQIIENVIKIFHMGKQDPNLAQMFPELYYF